jgi:hypothetical protein
VGRGEQLDTRPDPGVVTDGDPGDVEADEAEVREDPLADLDLVAVLAPERRTDVAPFAERPEQLAQRARRPGPASRR